MSEPTILEQLEAASKAVEEISTADEAQLAAATTSVGGFRTCQEKLEGF